MQYVRFKIRNTTTCENAFVKVPIGGLNEPQVNLDKYKQDFTDAENKLFGTSNSEPTQLLFDHYMVWTVPGNVAKGYEKKIAYNKTDGCIITAKLVETKP